MGSEEYPHQDMKELLHQFLEIPRGGGQHRIDRFGLPAPQIVLQHPVVIFQMPDQRLYSRTAAERVARKTCGFIQVVYRLFYYKSNVFEFIRSIPFIMSYSFSNLSQSDIYLGDGCSSEG